MLYDNGLESDIVSPNYVADFAFINGMALTSEEVVTVSNLYGEENCPTGRQNELTEFFEAVYKGS